MIVAGTGHRPDKLGGYTQQAHERLVRVATKWPRLRHPSVVISGMALGWDMALAEAATSLLIPLHAYVPFKGQESRWNAAYQTQYHNLLSCADEVIVLSQTNDNAAAKMQARNVAMMNNTDAVLAMWDGSPGGTANCLLYADTQMIPIYNLYHTYLEFN